MALKYKPIRNENVERGWKNTLAIELIIDTLEKRYPGIEKTFNEQLGVSIRRVKLIGSTVKTTYFSEGKEELIDETPCIIPTAGSSTE